ncbi:MAG: xylulokinase [Thermoproteota archaeon]
MSYLLCIDLGTSACKSVIYDQEFNVRAYESEEIPMLFPRPRWIEQRPEEWWAISCVVIKRLLKTTGIKPEDIAGVGVCGQGHGPVLLDSEWRVLSPCIIWPDLRAIKQAESIEKNLHRHVSAYYTAAKMLWIKENLPEIFDKMCKFILPKDYVRMRLTDTAITDEGDASGTMMYSRDSRSWDYQLIDFIGIPREKLPDISPSEKVVGEVTQKASIETNLRTTTPVIAGTADYLCTELALSCYLKQKKAVIYLGSAPSIFTIGKDGKPKGGFMGIGGASLRWFRERFCCLDTSRITYDLLDEEAEKVEPGSEGVLFLPHMMGERNPNYEPHAQGMIFGLSLGHERSTIVRSMMEGVAFQLKMILNNLQNVEELDEILVVGGGAKSLVWAQVISDVFNVEVCVPHILEVGTLGLAVLLSSGLGVYGDVSKAQKKINLKIVRRIRPREEFKRKYEEVFALYCDLERMLARFSKKIRFLF